MINTNINSTNVTIKDLINNTCYLFGVRGNTVNGCGLWTVTVNQTLIELEPSTTDPTLCTDSSKRYYI